MAKVIREFSRSQRVAETLQRELAPMLRRELRDPRLSLVTISRVTLSPDLAYATIYITFFKDDNEEIKTNLKILNNAAGHLRSLLAKHSLLRKTPALRFVHDTSTVQAQHVFNLIDSVSSKEGNV